MTSRLSKSGYKEGGIRQYRRSIFEASAPDFSKMAANNEDPVPADVRSLIEKKPSNPMMASPRQNPGWPTVLQSNPLPMGAL